MLPWATGWSSDAGALHADGVRARDALAESRRRFGDLLNTGSEAGIIFTSSGTEAANLAVKGCALASMKTGRHIVASVAEHPAVLQSLAWLDGLGFSHDLVGVDGEGRVCVEELRDRIREDTVLVCVQLANQDIGTIQPVKEVVEIAHARGVPVFADAAFACGWMPVDVRTLNVDLLSVAPYRFGGPKGVGVLYKGDQCRVQPIIHGGIQEDGRRAGAENVAAIVGAGVAAEQLKMEGAGRFERAESHVETTMVRECRKKIPHVQFNGPEPGQGRCPLGLNVSFEFIEGEGVVLMSDVRGLAISSGSACLSRKLNVSHVLEAIGVPNELAPGSVILSPGTEAGAAEVEQAVATLSTVVERLRSMSGEWEAFQKGELSSRIVGRD